MYSSSSQSRGFSSSYFDNGGSTSARSSSTASSSLPFRSSGMSYAGGHLYSGVENISSSRPFGSYSQYSSSRVSSTGNSSSSLSENPTGSYPYSSYISASSISSGSSSSAAEFSRSATSNVAHETSRFSSSSAANRGGSSSYTQSSLYSGGGIYGDSGPKHPTTSTNLGSTPRYAAQQESLSNFGSASSSSSTSVPNVDGTSFSSSKAKNSDSAYVSRDATKDGSYYADLRSVGTSNTSSGYQRDNPSRFSSESFHYSSAQSNNDTRAPSSSRSYSSGKGSNDSHDRSTEPYTRVAQVPADQENLEELWKGLNAALNSDSSGSGGNYVNDSGNSGSHRRPRSRGSSRPSSRPSSRSNTPSRRRDGDEGSSRRGGQSPYHSRSDMNDFNDNMNSARSRGDSTPGSARSLHRVDKTRYYRILGVEPTASSSDIKKAFHKLARDCHPDKGGDEESFKELTKAYEILSNEQKRKVYDEEGEEGLENPPEADPLSAMFGKHKESAVQPIVIKLDVELQHLFTGKTETLTYERTLNCGVCKGTGHMSGNEAPQCPQCAGVGSVTQLAQLGFFMQQIHMVCPACQGSGRFLPAPDRCTQCDGKRSVTKQAQLNIFIDPGMKNRQRITFSRVGNEGNNDVGDVIVELRQLPHKRFIRKGNDLGVLKHISLADALCGLELQLETLDHRKLLIRGREGDIIKPGDVRVIAHEGMPRWKRPFDRGCLYIKFQVDFPSPGAFTMGDRVALAYVLRQRTESNGAPSPRRGWLDHRDVEEHEMDVGHETSFGKSENDCEKEAYHEDDSETAQTCHMS